MSRGRVRAQDVADRAARVVPPAVVVVASFAFLAANALRVDDWAVMTDELLYTKLATAIATTGSPVPTVHGEYYGALAQLYPFLLAPLYAVLDAPAAFRGAHALNAALMASAAVPAYLLARTVVPRWAAAASAFAAVITPWALLTGFVMSESAAYAAFAWALLALASTLAAPSRASDVLLLAAMAVAFLARTQFVVLVPVVPVAILGFELATARDGRAGRRRRAAAAARAAVARHRVLGLAYGAAALLAIVLLAAGSLDAVLGNYGVTVTEGSVLPAGVWTSAAAHLVALSVGLGVLPVVLAFAWALAAVARAAVSAAGALAVLTLVIVPAMSLQVASYDLRFGETDLVRDRYLFYVVPLVTAAAAAALVQRPPGGITVAACAAAFAVLVRSYDFPVVEPFTVDSPVALLNERIVELAGSLAPGTFVATVGVLLTAAFLMARRLVPGPVLATGVLALMAAFGLASGQDAFARVIDSIGPSGRSVGAGPATPADWVDAAVPEDRAAAMLAYPVGGGWDTSAVRWWDVEFWNARVAEALVGPGREFSYTPFPVAELAVDWDSGAVRSASQPPFVVVAGDDARLRLAGARRADRNGLELLAAARPYRAEWATRGLDADGWLRPGRPAALRVYAGSAATDAIASLDVVLKAPDAAPATYTFTSGGDARTATVAPSQAALEHLDVCVPAGGHVDLSLATDAAAELPEVAVGPSPAGTRVVGIRLERIVLTRGGPCTG